MSTPGLSLTKTVSAVVVAEKSRFFLSSPSCLAPEQGHGFNVNGGRGCGLGKQRGGGNSKCLSRNKATVIDVITDNVVWRVTPGRDGLVFFSVVECVHLPADTTEIH